MKGDLLLSTAFTALATAMFCEALTLPRGLFGTLGPGYFPKIVLGSLILASGSLTLRLLLRALRGAKGGTNAPAKAPFPFEKYRFVILVFAAFFIYLFTMKGVGFLPATLAFMVVTMWLLAPDRKNPKTLGIIAFTSALLTFGLYSLFTYAFSVMLPSGTLF